MKNEVIRTYQNLRNFVLADSPDSAEAAALVAAFEALGEEASYRPSLEALARLRDERLDRSLDLDESEVLARCAFADLAGTAEALDLVEGIIVSAGTQEDAFARILSERPIAGEMVEVRLLVRDLPKLADLLGTDVESLRSGANLFA